MKATTAITIIITMCFIPPTYDPPPIFPAANPPNTASIIDMLNKMVLSASKSRDAIAENVPPPSAAPGVSSIISWTTANSLKNCEERITEIPKNTAKAM